MIESFKVNDEDRAVLDAVENKLRRLNRANSRGAAIKEAIRISHNILNIIFHEESHTIPPITENGHTQKVFIERVSSNSIDLDGKRKDKTTISL